ncbi:MAG: cupin domain-containing protein [Meiothermus sp.]
MMVSKENAEHYVWKLVCDGWHLVRPGELSVILERMPPGTAEDRHLHRQVRQFFFVLSGEVSLELDGKVERLRAGEGLEVAPGLPHQMRNEPSSDVEFLLVSSGISREDRYPA